MHKDTATLGTQDIHYTVGVARTQAFSFHNLAASGQLRAWVSCYIIKLLLFFF